MYIGRKMFPVIGRSARMEDRQLCDDGGRPPTVLVSRGKASQSRAGYSAQRSVWFRLHKN